MSGIPATLGGELGIARPAWIAILICALSLGASLAIAVWAWRRRATAAAAGSFAAMTFAEAVWNAGHLGELASSSLAAKVAWDAVQTAPAVATALFMLVFASQYSGRRIPGWLLVVIGVGLSAPVLPILVAPLDGTLRASARLDPPYGALVYDFTAWDIAYIAESLAVSLVALALLIGLLLHQRAPFRTQTAGVALSAAFPVVFGFTWLVLDLRLQGERDVSHVAFAASSVVTAWTLSRGRLFDLVPIAREAVLERLTDAVLVIDRAGRVVDVNQLAASLLQRGPYAVLGRPADVVLQDWVEVLPMIAGEEAQQQEVVFPGSAGSRWYDARWAPLRDGRGRVVGGTLVLRDVTPLHQARLVLEQRVQQGSEELALSESRAAVLAVELEQARRLQLIGRVAAGVAHDFNNLLTVISASVGVARRAHAEGSQVAGLLDEALQAVDSAAAVTRQLLTFSRKQPNEPCRMVVPTALAHMEAVLRRLAHPARIILAPPPAELWAIYIDPAQLQQVLMNLIVNVRDAMPGGGTIDVAACNVTIAAGEPSTRKPGDFVRLEVRDRGPGIDPEVQAHLFEPFFTTKALGEGTGLGLSVVHGIVHGSDGFIEVESAPETGTTMAIYLRRAAG